MSFLELFYNTFVGGLFALSYKSFQEERTLNIKTIFYIHVFSTCEEYVHVVGIKIITISDTYIYWPIFSKCISNTV